MRNTCDNNIINFITIYVGIIFQMYIFYYKIEVRIAELRMTLTNCGKALGYDTRVCLLFILFIYKYRIKRTAMLFHVIRRMHNCRAESASRPLCHDLRQG